MKNLCSITVHLLIIKSVFTLRFESWPQLSAFYFSQDIFVPGLQAIDGTRSLRN